MSFLFAKNQPVGQQVGIQDYGSSKYGANEPRIFGCVKVPTNLIWLGPVSPHTTSQSGGKGGGAPSSSQTTYSASFAVAIAVGLIKGIAQIWADSKLVYNCTNLSTAADLAVAHAFIPYISNYAGLHLGSTTQLPDPIMAQILTPGANYSANSYVNYVNLCPAFRGQSYLVFHNYSFGSGGSRVPSIEVEGCQGPNVSIASSGGLQVVTRGGCPVATVIQTILEDAGISDVHIDVSDVPALNIPGLIVYGDKRRDALDRILQAYDIGFCETNGTLTFFPLYRTPAFNIPFTDVATTAGGGRNGNTMKDPYPFTDTKEMDLPYQVNINFKNNGLVLTEGTTIYQTTYSDCTQGYQRVFGAATQVVSVDMPDFAMAPADAAQIANKQLYRAWTERLTLAPLVLPRQYINAEPNDIFTTTYGGQTLTFRITKVTIGRDFSVELEAAQFSSAASSSISTGANPWGNVGQHAPFATDIQLFLLNLPSMQSTDAIKAGFYVAASWAGGSGQGANLYHSRDGGASYGSSTAPITTLQSSAITGTVVGTLADGPYYEFDNVSTLVVDLDEADANQVLESVSRATLFTGTNALYIGTLTDNATRPYNQFEILQFLTVGLNPDRTQATFSGLLRGRKGTENYIPLHVAGERMVLLTGPGVSFIAAENRDLNVAQNWQLVAPGAVFMGTGAVTQSFTDRAANLIPLNPRCFVGEQAVGSYEPTFSWWRRTRYGGLILEPGGAPLGETVETYRIILYDLSGNRVAYHDVTPTHQLLAPATFTYTQAMRLADFGSASYDLTGYTASVCMMSTLVSEGNPALNLFTFTM